MSIPLYKRRSLRRHSTDAEAALWAILRGRRFAGFKFRRQHSLGPFIVDFYCPMRRLVVELDGGQHYEPEAQAEDAKRDRYLVGRDIAVVRFATDLVFRDRRSVEVGMALGLGAGDLGPEDGR